MVMKDKVEERGGERVREKGDRDEERMRAWRDREGGRCEREHRVLRAFTRVRTSSQK
jgi:hypothetical protein